MLLNNRYWIECTECLRAGLRQHRAYAQMHLHFQLVITQSNKKNNIVHSEPFINNCQSRIYRASFPYASLSILYSISHDVRITETVRKTDTNHIEKNRRHLHWIVYIMRGVYRYSEIPDTGAKPDVLFLIYTYTYNPTIIIVCSQCMQMLCVVEVHTCI